MNMSTDGMENISSSTVAAPENNAGWTTIDYVYIGSEMVVSLLTVLVNGLVLAALFRYPSLRTVTNMYIGSQATADLLVGFLVSPLAALSYTGLPRNFHACIFVNSLVNIFATISILSLVCVAFDRHAAIQYPIFHLNLGTKELAFKITAFVWVLGFVIGTLPLMGWHCVPGENFNRCAYMAVIPVEYNVYIQLFGVLVPALLFVLFVNSGIYYTYRKSQSKQSDGSRVLPGKSYKALNAKEIKLAILISALFLMFATCWLPLCIINTLRLWSPATEIHFPFLLFCVVLSHFNSFINPILYAVNQPGFRQIIDRHLACGSRPKQNTSYTSTHTTHFAHTSVSSFREIAQGTITSPHADRLATIVEEYREKSSKADRLAALDNSPPATSTVEEPRTSGTETPNTLTLVVSSSDGNLPSGVCNDKARRTETSDSVMEFSGVLSFFDLWR